MNLPPQPEEPKVSVVVPVFNVAPYIRECLDSLLRQTLREIEIILIDDCSTDGSLAICREYVAKDQRVRLIENEVNLRQGLSRNKGIEAARGAYIGFVDPDDWVDDDFYAQLYGLAETTKAEIAKGGRQKYTFEGKYNPQPLLNRQIQKGLKNGVPVYQLFVYEHTTAIYKRTLLTEGEVRYPDIRNGEDIIFLLEATFPVKTLALTNTTFYYYRERENSTVGVKGREYFDSILRYFQLHTDFINKHLSEKKEYDRAFRRGLRTVQLRYSELRNEKNLKEYEYNYLKEMLLISAQYKYDLNYIFENFFPEVSCKTKLIRKLMKHFRFLPGKNKSKA